MEIKATKVKQMNRAKLFLIGGIAVALVLSIAIGYLFALMVKPTERRLNNFTVGNIQIELKEENWDKVTSSETILYPSKTLPKDPVIKNTSKDPNGAYVYFKISVPVAAVSLVDGNSQKLPEQAAELFSYQTNPEWALIQGPDISADSAYHEYVYAYLSPLEQGASTSPLFNEVTFANVLEGTLEKDKVIDILVEAMGIQKDYMDASGSTLAQQLADIYNNHLKLQN